MSVEDAPAKELQAAVVSALWTLDGGSNCHRPGAFRAAASSVSRIQSDLDFLAALAARSISSASAGSNRQNSRPSREAPSGSGGLPSLVRLLMLRFFSVRTQSACLRSGYRLLCVRKKTRPMSTNPQNAIRGYQTTLKSIPENTPLRESSAPGPGENGRIVEVAFKPANPRFRESSAKPPRKRPNTECRSREFLSPAEVEKLMEAAQGVGRHGHRDATMILIAYRHALTQRGRRVSGSL